MHRLLVIIGLLALAGCATTNPYATFATAGGAYAEKLDAVLLAAERTGVDATSWRLLDADLLANATPEQYREYSEKDAARSDVLQRLRRHGKQLARYFKALSDLAGSDAPDVAAASVARAWDATAALGKGLREDLAFPASGTATEPLKIVLRASIKGAMRKELEKRADDIRQELATQEALLGVLTETIGHDVKLGITIAEHLLVIDPLVAEKPIRGHESWVATRQRLQLAQETVAEVGAARSAAAALVKAFESITAEPGTAGTNEGTAP